MLRVCLPLVFLLIPCATQGQESRLRRVIPDSIQNVFSSRGEEKSATALYDDYAGLPGFGSRKTLAVKPQLPVNSVLPSDMVESMVLTEHLVPAIYIDGVGYVSINHPSLAPWLDEADLDGIEENPSVVMIPEYRLSRQLESAALSSAGSLRGRNTDNATTLSYPKSDQKAPIVVSSERGWVKETEKYVVHFLEGDCSIRQGDDSAQGPCGIVWVDKQRNEYYGTREVTVFLESGPSEDPLKIELGEGQTSTRIYDRKWLGRFYTLATVPTLIMNPQPPQEEEPPILQRALAMMSPDHSVIAQVQYVAETPAPSATKTEGVRFRKVTLNSIGDRLASGSFDVYKGNKDRGIAIITNGVNLVIEGVQGHDMISGDIVDISAENVVAWTSFSPQKLSPGSSFSMEESEDLEVYLEGNIIYRDATRTIEAQRMYYDVKNQIAYVLDAQLSTTIEDIKGLSGAVRIKAEILQQLGDGLFTAKNSLLTTSQLGEPSTSIRSRNMTLNQNVVGTRFGSSEPEARHILVAENNYLAIGKVPVFYWPWMAADLRDPTFYIENLSYGNSSTYGNQIRTKWNPFQILNIPRPKWLKGSVSVSWLERRGIGHGANFSYTPDSFLSCAGPVRGQLDYWGIHDKGTDNLGGGRNGVTYPHSYRYRFSWKHRQEVESLWKFDGPWTITAQVGKESDRNFSNQYFPNTWNNADNNTTGLDLKKYCGNASLQLSTEYALDDFVTNANKLPELKHTWLGQSLLNDRLTWYERTRVGFMDYQTADAPYDWAKDGRYFNYLPWELQPGSTNAIPNPNTPGAPSPQTINSSFEYFSTRHELDAPFNLGPVRCVPYVLGEFAHWGKDRTGKDVQRWYGQGGVRLNLPFWKVDPNCSSRTWYVNGLAHKVDFDAEFSYARADQSMDNLILTDALDSWSLEDFRRRYSVTTFGGGIPLKFDPRYYALRSGLAGSVTAGNTEIADDMTLFRFGVTNRWQTKRGPVGRRHIIDWITLSAHFNYYPQEKYNYGESVGLIDYDFLWHVGDRFSLFSSGLYDTFDEGQRITRLGAIWQRPNRGSVNVMLDQLDGIIDKTYLTLGFSYTMNEKYSMSYSTSFDIREKWEITGHNFMFTRTGEAFRIMIGANYSEYRDDWSISFGIEPVFMRGIASKMQQQSNSMMNQRR